MLADAFYEGVKKIMSDWAAYNANPYSSIDDSGYHGDYYEVVKYEVIRDIEKLLVSSQIGTLDELKAENVMEEERQAKSRVEVVKGADSIRFTWDEWAHVFRDKDKDDGSEGHSDGLDCIRSNY